MFDVKHPNVPISADTIRRVQPLISHIRAHEAAVATAEYDPVKSPHVMDPLLLKHVFDPSLFNDALFFDLFAGMATEAERAINGWFRVYIDGMLSPKYENEVLLNSPDSGENFPHFMSRVTGGRKFGIVVNGAEQWSDPLARMAARVFAPVVEAQGHWRSMIEVTLFIGNYGYTPFGIHIDDPYTSVVHFHAGPTTKAMTLFSRSAFHRLNGPRKNCFNPELLTPHGQTFSIESGDVFLLPPHWYHIGNTDGFSIGIAFAISKYTDEKVSQQMLQHAITEQRLRGNVSQIIARAEAAGDTMAEWLRRIRIEHGAPTASRRWLRYSYTCHEKDTVTPDAGWIRDPDFPLNTVEVGDDLLVFARGNHIRLRRGAVGTTLLEAIPHTPFSARDLYSSLKGNVSLEALLGILVQLRRLGGVLPISATAQQ
ncbi:hypothetical protein FAZ95_07250 [Trinickia violacea]|uniref:JmjC domain-containing protein n=1 Tax=Trinickia violacea TaxID=2571746 RepID=A0A4P8IL84_9BURK|nr:hypothetical protein [Trinickia violacea]QCP48996.1 hypothetical protein FAZ95_07250 [Trinickia violacea]